MAMAMAKRVCFNVSRSNSMLQREAAAAGWVGAQEAQALTKGQCRRSHTSLSGAGTELRVHPPTAAGRQRP